MSVVSAFGEEGPMGSSTLTLVRKFDVVQSKTVTRSRIIPSVRRARCPTPNVPPAPIKFPRDMGAEGRWSLIACVTDDRLLVIWSSSRAISPTDAIDSEVGGLSSDVCTICT